ncbi:MAG: group III truncated hemoglobin [Oleiphilaceae bacterium]|nr:group III truncated hemoglobin [Oleiphilaceae bacterium]
MSATPLPPQKPLNHGDLDNETSISALVEAFYGRVLEDPLLRPVFLDIAGIDLDSHLPRIKAYWRKMLLGHKDYQRNMVAHHQALNQHFTLQPRHFQRWLSLFEGTLDRHFAGPGADRARQLARTIIGNLQQRLSEQNPADCPMAQLH